MLETIIGWLASVVGEGLEAIVNLFFGCLQLDLNVFINVFPLLPTSYQIFQAIGVGLVLGIALFQLTKFFGGQIVEIKDTPVRILIRSAASVALIWFGGYIISMVVDLARTPYDTFINGVNAVQIGFRDINIGETMFNGGATDAAAVVLGPGTLLVLSLILMLLIGWNILKLMVEVCERFIMVGLLAYSAPLIYPTLSSQSTSSIFKKWLGMFFGQCILMTLTVWSLKLVLSGFAFSAGPDAMPYFVRFVLTLAMCKVAQRIDTYLQQLGIGVASTGGNLLDEAIGVAASLGAMGRSKNAGNNGNANSVLGTDGDKRTMSRFGGLFGAASNAFQKGVRSFKNGDDMTTVKQTMGQAAKDGATGAYSRVRDKADSIFTARKESQAKQTAEAAKQGAEAFEKRSQRYQAHNGSAERYSDDIQKKAAAMGMTAQQYAKTQFGSNGAGSVYTRNDGTVGLNKAAQDAGLQWTKGKTDGKIGQIKGTDQAVGEHIASNYAKASAHPEYQAAMVETAREGSKLAAEEALMNPNFELKDNDQVGAALIDNAFGEEFTKVYGQPDKNGDYGDMAEFQSALDATAANEVEPGGEGVSNIVASTDKKTGGRSVSVDYQAASGQSYKVEMKDEVAYQRSDAGEQRDMKKITTKNGESYYTRVTSVEVARDGSPSRQNTPSHSPTTVQGGRTKTQVSSADRSSTSSSVPTKRASDLGNNSLKKSRREKK